MDKKKYSFKLNFPAWLYVILPIIIICTLPIIVTRIASMSHMIGEDDYSPFFDITAICVSLIVLVFATLVTFNARYSLSNKTLKIIIGVFFSTIKLKDAVKLIYYKSLGKLVIYHSARGELAETFITINKATFDNFAGKIKTFAPHIEYDIVYETQE